jgi:hypothetical protein
LQVLDIEHDLTLWRQHICAADCDKLLGRINLCREPRPMLARLIESGIPTEAAGNHRLSEAPQQAPQASRQLGLKPTSGVR